MIVHTKKFDNKGHDATEISPRFSRENCALCKWVSKLVKIEENRVVFTSK